MGSAACHYLAKRGAEVTGLEQFDVTHENGSHHGESRMIRQSYYEHPGYVPLLRRAYSLWRGLEQLSGVPLLSETGGLYMGSPGAEIVTGALRAAQEHGLPHELLDAAGIRRRFPQFDVPDNFTGFHETRAGFLRPEAAIRAHAAEARKYGAEIHERQRVLSWTTRSSGVEVITAEETHEGDQLVITAGPWAREMITGLGIRLEVTRQIVGWFQPQAQPERYLEECFPCWFIETDSPHGHYGFPLAPESGALKVALHKPGIPALPGGTGGQAPTPEESETLRGILNRFIPGAGGILTSASTCLYTNSPDHHFVVGLHPTAERVSVAAGFSGHGFKFASVIGEILADLALHGATPHPIDLFDPARFG